MNSHNFMQILLHTVSTPTAHALALSKGGWEGWLQCELWNSINDSGTSIEREVQYPNLNLYCDLRCEIENRTSWIELKAFGIFQERHSSAFLDSFANDVLKLEAVPPQDRKIAILVVSKSIGGDLIVEIKRRWPAVQEMSDDTVSVFYLVF